VVEIVLGLTSAIGNVNRHESTSAVANHHRPHGEVMVVTTSGAKERDSGLGQVWLDWPEDDEIRESMTTEWNSGLTLALLYSGCKFKFN
jgi:hypothetical protein